MRIKKTDGRAIWILIFMIIFAYLAFAQPSPLNIDGRAISNGSNGVPAGTPVWINNTVTGQSITVTTDDPGPPPLKGIYSAVITGNIGSLIKVRAWNSTYYGENESVAVSGTTTINIILNISRPSETNITIIAPSNNSKKNTSSVFNLTANVSVIGANGINCNATIYFSSNRANLTVDQNFTNLLGDINSGEGSTTTWNLSGIRHGNVEVTVESRCSSDGINLFGLNHYTINLSINDTSPPGVTLLSPLNNTWNKGNINFTFNTSEFTGIKNCSLYIDGRFNQTHYGIEANTAYSFMLNSSPEQQHSWMVSCVDNSTNSNEGNSSLYFYNSDSTAPNVTLLFPLNRSLMENYTIRFSYNATDNINISNCTLIVNGAVRSANYSVNEGVLSNFTIPFSGGDYNWSVNCSDNSGNIAYSGFYMILTPDFFINLSYFIFSEQNFVERQVLEINATVFNLKDVNATGNITVQLYENGPGEGGTHLRNFSTNITGLSNATFTINYTTTIGTYSIFALVDAPIVPNGTIIEENESNNIANRTIFVSSYQIYYGDIVSSIVLDTQANLSVFAWLNISNFRGNIIAADSDSILDFNSLLALTRNTTNNLTINDLEDVDTALNLSNKTDSINRTYRNGDLLKGTLNFSVFSQTISFVPVVNSTNTSSFVTGIVWDSSDENNGQYNGTQDIAFITQVSRGSIGFYGMYDYEVMVPSSLKLYISPNNEDSITFYREIK